MRWQEYIEQREDMMLGKPVFKGTRVSVEVVLEHLGQGWTEAELLASYPRLTANHIRAACAFAASSLSSELTVMLTEPSR